MIKWYDIAVLPVAVFVALSTNGCAPTGRTKAAMPAADVRNLLSDELVALFGNGRGDTVSGESFLLPVVPGIPFDMSDLTFASGSDMLSSPENIDKAYRFSRMAGKVKELTDSVWRNPPESLEELFIRQGVIDPDADMITSPTYNEAFCPLYPVPAFRDSATTIAWSVYRNGEGRRRHISGDGTACRIYLEIMRIGVEYGDKLHGCDFSGRTIAVAKEMIVARALSMTTFCNKVKAGRHGSEISKRRAACMESEGPQIIGFVLEIMGGRRNDRRNGDIPSSR